MNRIVSLIASGTEIVCALGLEDQVVGRSHECDYPPLVKAAFPGDRIVLAVADGVPQASEVASAVVQTLANAGVSPDDEVVPVCRHSRHPGHR